MVRANPDHSGGPGIDMPNWACMTSAPLHRAGAAPAKPAGEVATFPRCHNHKKQPSRPCPVQVLFKHVQTLLADTTILIAETGDSIFNCAKLHLPDGCA